MLSHCHTVAGSWTRTWYSWGRGVTPADPVTEEWEFESLNWVIISAGKLILLFTKGQSVVFCGWRRPVDSIPSCRWLAQKGNAVVRANRGGAGVFQSVTVTTGTITVAYWIHLDKC